jgi:DNA-binding IclR family transcriptional regulator
LIDQLLAGPCTLEEISRHLKIDGSDAIKYCKIMEKDGLISRRLQSGKLYFHAVDESIACQQAE